MFPFVVQPYWARYIFVLPAQENSRGSRRAANVFTAGRARARSEAALWFLMCPFCAVDTSARRTSIIRVLGIYSPCPVAHKDR